MFAEIARYPGIASYGTCGFRGGRPYQGSIEIVDVITGLKRWDLQSQGSLSIEKKLRVEPSWDDQGKHRLEASSEVG